MRAHFHMQVIWEICQTIVPYLAALKDRVLQHKQTNTACSKPGHQTFRSVMKSEEHMNESENDHRVHILLWEIHFHSIHIKCTYSQVIRDVDVFASSSDLEKCCITSL